MSGDVKNDMLSVDQIIKKYGYYCRDCHRHDTIIFDEVIGRPWCVYCALQVSEEHCRARGKEIDELQTRAHELRRDNDVLAAEVRKLCLLVHQLTESIEKGRCGHE